jgi:translocation and assembly module TamB
MRRKLLIAAASLLGLVLLFIAAIFFYIRTGRLDLLLRDQIVAELDDAGIRAELDKSTLDLSGYSVSLEGLRMFVKKTGKELGEIERLTARFSVVSYLNQELNITDVEVVNPRFNLEIDEKGELNLDPLLNQPRRKPEEPKGPISFLTAAYRIEGGKLHLVDKQRNVVADLNGISARLTPADPGALREELNHALQLTVAGGDASYEGRKIDKLRAEVAARLTQSNAQVDKFELHSDLGKLSLTGKVDSFSPIKYESSDLHLEADAEQVARVFAPGTAVRGNVVVSARVNGTGADYHAAGSLESGGLVLDGVRLAGLKVKSDVHGKGSEYDATGELASGSIQGRGFQVGSLSIGGAKIKGKDDDFDLSGGLRLVSLSNGSVKVNSIRGTLTADRDRAGLSNFTADLLGGVVSGSASVAINGGSSKLDARFQSIDLDQVTTLASAREVKVSGTTSGTVALSFPGFDFERATGRIVADIDGEVSASDGSGSATPADGEVIAIATGNGLRVERAQIRSGSTTINATGDMRWNGRGAFDVDVKATDLAELQSIVESFGVVPQEIKDEYEYALEGEGSFTGRAELADGETTITGHLELGSIQLHDEDAGSFSGDISYSPSQLNITNGSLVKQDGSRAEFELNAPLKTEDQIALKANVQQFSLATIIKTALPGFNDFVNRGAVTGVIDLKGLPGPRTIEGTARVSLADAEFNTFSSKDSDEMEKVSVPEFTGDLSFAQSVLTVNNLRMRAGDSEVVGQGRLNLDTYEYSIDAGAQNVDLARVSGALPENVSLSGRADLKLVGQGKFGKSDDWSELRLNGTIDGRSVAINGRDLGDAKLTAVTENGLLKFEATGQIAGEMRSVTATVDLRDRDNYPIAANIEFTDTDIAPYLSWVAPELSGISGVASGSIKLGGPLQNPDNIEVVATFTKLELGGAISEGRRYTIVNQAPVVLRGGTTGITLEPAVFTGEGTSLALEGGLVREGSGRSSLSVNGEINLRLLSSFTPIVFATGIAEVQASIAGSLDSPQLLGVMNLKDVGVRVVDFPISAAHGNGQIRFTSNQALIESFVASTPGGGTIAIGGGAALAGLVPDRWRLEINADQVGAEYPRDTHTVVDADLTLQGNRRLQILSGDVEVRRASYTEDVTLEELITTGGPFQPSFLETGPGGSGAPLGLQTTLDLHIAADNTLIVQNNLADAVGSAFLNLRGSLDDPVISGRVLLSRGTLEFRNGRWDLIRGIITIPGRRGAEVVVDFQAEADIRGYHLTTNFNGVPSKLQVQVRSEPTLPEAEIISLVLTGSVNPDRSTVASTTQTGLGLAQSILSASLSEQLERGTQRLFGLSRFSIDPLLVGRGNDPTARITIGQRVTRDLTVTYSQNLSSGPSGMEQIVLVEYRLSNRFSVVGYRNEFGALGFDVRLRKRF